MSCHVRDVRSVESHQFGLFAKQYFSNKFLVLTYYSMVTFVLPIFICGIYGVVNNDMIRDGNDIGLQQFKCLVEIQRCRMQTNNIARYQWVLLQRFLEISRWWSQIHRRTFRLVHNSYEKKMKTESQTFLEISGAWGHYLDSN